MFGKKYSLKDPKDRKWKIGKDKESMTEKRNQRELLWFQTGGALNFITAAPHCGFVMICPCPNIHKAAMSACMANFTDCTKTVSKELCSLIKKIGMNTFVS
jgi:hypothetical protein